MMINSEWNELQNLRDKLQNSELGPGAIVDEEWGIIEQSLDHFIKDSNWNKIIDLREMFEFLVVGETSGGMPLVQKLTKFSIQAAEQTMNRQLMARYYHDSAENYHRRGYNQESIEAFNIANIIYKEIGDKTNALNSYYMSSLPHRALGERIQARQILEEVLKETDKDDPWRGNPLEVIAWMERDEGEYNKAENVLIEVLQLYERHEGCESVHIVQTLTDLGEVIGLQGRYEEAEGLFQKSLNMMKNFGGLYERQESRTKLKFAESLIRQKKYDKAIKLLNEADDKIRGYGHYYDLLGGIELARAFIFFQQGNLGGAFRKIRVLLRYRKEIKLSYLTFAKQFAKKYRLLLGTTRYYKNNLNRMVFMCV